MSTPGADTSPGGSEPPALRTLRGALLGTLLLGMAGTLLELWLLEHTEDVWQQAPLWLLVLGFLALAVRFLVPRPGSMRLLQAVMVAFVASGLVGTWWHYEGNVAFELEMYPSRAGWELFREAVAGATPTLAAGTMVVLGLLGLIYTLGHPLLQRD